MNTINNIQKKIKIIISFIFIMFFTYSCDDNNYKEKNFDISMQKITGEWIRQTYSLPEDSYFYIQTYRGSYSLVYDRKNANFLRKSTSGITIRNGIIDYKINN